MPIYRSFFLQLIPLAALTVSANTVNLTGKVVDHDEKFPVVGAQVSLKTAKLSTTTGNNGLFALVGEPASLFPGKPGQSFAPRWQHGLMLVTAQSRDMATLSVHDLQGRQIGITQWLAVAGTEYTLNPRALLGGIPTQGVLLARMRLGKQEHVFRMTGNGVAGPAYFANEAPRQRGPLARHSAVTVVDTLVVSKEGFETVQIPISNYVGELEDIELEEEKHVALGRMLIADGVSAYLKVLDLETGTVLDSFQVSAAGAAVYTTEDGRFGFAVQGGINGKVNVVYSGLYVEPHGDHVHLEKVAPKLLPWELTGVKPVHFVSHHGETALFFDGERDTTLVPGQAPSQVHFVKESEFLMTEPTIKKFTLAGPQHGVALAGNSGRYLVSVPDSRFADFTSTGSTPFGLKVYDANFAELQDFSDTTNFARSCRGLHGEAANDIHVIFGCNGTLDSGALVLSWNPGANEYTSKKIKYPRDGLNRGAGTVKGHAERNFFLGNLGGNHLARFRVEADSLLDSDIVDLGAALGGFEFEREHGEHAVVLTRDGKLHVFDVKTGWNNKSEIQLWDNAASNRWETGKRVPKLVTGPGRAYVSDPHEGKVYEIDIEHAEVVRTISLPGQPWNMAVFGWYEVFGENTGHH